MKKWAPLRKSEKCPEAGAPVKVMRKDEPPAAKVRKTSETKNVSRIEKSVEKSAKKMRITEKSAKPSEKSVKPSEKSVKPGGSLEKSVDAEPLQDEARPVDDEDGLQDEVRFVEELIDGEDVHEINSEEACVHTPEPHDEAPSAFREMRDTRVDVENSLIGKRVRVLEEDKLHMQRFGETGTITEINVSEASVSVNFDKATSMSAVRMPWCILGLRVEPEKKSAVRVKTLDKLSNEAKFEMLLRAGIESPFERAPEMLNAAEEMMSPHQLDAWLRMWRLSLRGIAEVAK